MGEIVLVILAILGLVLVAVAFGLVPALPKDENGNVRAKQFWMCFSGGVLCLVLATASALATVYKEPEVASKKYYKIPQITNWYFVNPIECKKAIINEIAYTPESFAERNGCENELIDGEIDMIRLDCTAMLNNVFYMVEGERDCGQIHVMMAERANNPAE